MVGTPAGLRPGGPPVYVRPPLSPQQFESLQLVDPRFASSSWRSLFEAEGIFHHLAYSPKLPNHSLYWVPWPAAPSSRPRAADEPDQFLTQQAGEQGYRIFAVEGGLTPDELRQKVDRIERRSQMTPAERAAADAPGRRRVGGNATVG